MTIENWIKLAKTYYRLTREELLLGETVSDEEFWERYGLRVAH